ncbi:hypothetical protein K402DRAFT_275190 [Aulographum hederae CBS 113979]|uniref:Uncharacterized protein n=1 Tax=Aulographum hederae CBS 113979 TaxID=1176131 RepID=A0A6G1GIB3_9PEZI|nr:hypothetical protein K402DRAFT_275190 [Aulographum hederae CBS 113979]
MHLVLRWRRTPQSVLLQRCVCVLCLSVCFWMKSCRKLRAAADPLAEAFPEVGNELRSSIGDDRVREALLSPHEVKKCLNDSFGVDRVHRNKLAFLAESINDHHNAREVPPIPSAGWKRYNEIHRDIPPISIWNGKRFEQSMFPFAVCLGALADSASADESAHCLCHSRPVIPLGKASICGGPPGVSGYRRIMYQLYDSCA